MDEPNDQNQGEEDLAGYNSTPDLVKAYRASGVEAKRLADENRRKDELLAQMQAQMVANPRQDVPNRNDPRSRLDELGIPTDAIDAIVADRVEQRIQAAFMPLARSIEARGNVLAQYPDYQKFESDVAQFMRTDPALNQKYERMFQADPEGAMEYAFMKFGESRKKDHRQSSRERENGEAAHAAIPSSRSGEGRRPESQTDNVREAFKRYQETGSSRDAAAYAKARLRTVIKDEFLNQ